MSTNPSSTTDWKARYLESLDKQDKQQQVFSLLVTAILRLSFVGEGIDPLLDKQMASIRVMLRAGKISVVELNTLVAALDGQLKRIATVKDERAKAIAKGLMTLSSQLQQLKPEKTTSQLLGQFSSNLNTRSKKSSEYSILVNEYANIQSAVLADKNIQRISKPFWHKWQPGLNNETETSIEEVNQPYESLPDDIKIAKTPLDALSAVNLDLADESEQQTPDGSPSAEDEEPPFSRLNSMICSILQQLLQHIEPSAKSQQQYQRARQQVDKGLNWYELVPTLEDISAVIVSSVDHNQNEFEGFLKALNDRLLSAYEYISATQQIGDASLAVNLQHNDHMLDQVSAIQQTVSSANDLEQLKKEVNTRLDHIVTAMDEHQSNQQQQASNLSEQMDALLEQVKMMEAVSSQAEERLEEQRQLALRDALTQLPNREAYQQRLALEYERWQRYDRPLTIVVCDIDHFKQVNDNFGHLAGDKVLRIIAKTLSTRLRKTDFVGRYGGEEFVLLMPETDQMAALKVTEGVREAIANCPFHFKEQQLAITMSFGIAEFYAEDQCDTVFNRADQALYQAKQEGRNRCVMAGNKEPEE